ncbi:MAG: VWA domain-containing protein, partial [Acidobacteria bacterium]|nr:VWA domain-containing protein [Acidobacteriota bacterium]
MTSVMTAPGGKTSGLRAATMLCIGLLQSGADPAPLRPEVFAATATPGLSTSATQDSAVRLESHLTTIDFAAMDKNGRYVTDLAAAEIAVFHDGERRPISFFDSRLQRSLSRALAVVFALDISESMGQQIADQQSAARQFLSLVQRQSVFAVLGFNDQMRVFQRFTNKPDEIMRAFAKAEAAGGRTRLYDALDRSITMLMRDVPEFRGDRRLRRVVVVFTDGFDYTSTIDRKELVRRANSAGVTIYSVTVPSYFLSITGRQRVPTLLDASGIVAATGGRDFSAEQKDFSPIFRALAEEIHAGYTLAYIPPAEDLKDGRYHEVKITTSRSGVTLRQS